MLGPIGVPDIIAQARLGRSQTNLKLDLERAQIEVVTGESAEPMKATGGDPARLIALERSVSTLDSRTPLLSMAKSRAAGTQTSLESIQTSTDQMGVKLLRDIAAGDFSSARFTAKDARTALGQVIGALNVELSGRHLFAGAATGAPLMGKDASGASRPAVDAMLEDVQAIVKAEIEVPTNPALSIEENIDAAIKRYFDPLPTPAPVPAPRNFNTDIYRGAATLPPPVELADGEFLSYAMRADADELKAMMRGLAMAAVVVDPVGVTGPAQELSRERVMSLLDTAGKTILKATDDITMARSDLGLAESRIEAAQSRTTAQRSTLELARADLIGVDAYEAATRVNSLQSQLEAIYAMTARSSQLSLLNFLR